MDQQQAPGSESGETSAQRWSEKARQIIEHEGRDAFDSMLSFDFVQESRRGVPFEFDRAAILGTYDSMKELDFKITGVDVALAGDLHLLTRRRYTSPHTTTELLAVSVWTAGGRLARLIEFDVDDLDAALEELGRLAGEPVVRVDAA